MSEDFVIAMMAAIVSTDEAYDLHESVKRARALLRITREQLRDTAKANMANGLGMRAAS
jgi:hypothetical protein